MKLKRLFARLHAPEMGGDGGGAGGGFDDASISASSPADTGASTDDTGSTDAGAQDSGPSSMLEAIEQGLKTKPETEGDASAGDRLRDEQGRFAKKDGAEQPTAQDPAKAQTPPADDLAMPDGLSPKAQERFQSLVGRIKEREAALEHINSDVQAFRSIIQESRATPEEFSQAMDYMRMVKTGDLHGALEILDMQRRQIALAIGKPLPESDPLADFPDLRQAVENYRMDEAAAIEMARIRLWQGQQQRSQAQAMQAEQQHQTAQAARGSALKQIDQLAGAWAKSDPDFAAKEEVILQQLPNIAAQFPPHMWASQVKILYDTISAVPRSQPPRQTPAPLRSSGQSAGARQPSSMLEAISSGLGYANG